MLEWTYDEGETFDKPEELYREIFSQYRRYIEHILVYLGGVYLDAPVMGDQKKAYKFVSEEKQREALAFILEQLRAFPDWYCRLNEISHLEIRKWPSIWDWLLVL